MTTDTAAFCGGMIFLAVVIVWRIFFVTPHLYPRPGDRWYCDDGYDDD